MACVNPDGTVTAVARRVLVAVGATGSPPEVAAAAGVPLYRVRATMRELIDAGLVSEADGQWALTAEGRKRVAEA